MPKQPEAKKKPKKDQKSLSSLAKVEAVFTDETVTQIPLRALIVKLLLSAMVQRTWSATAGATKCTTRLRCTELLQPKCRAYYNNNGTNNQTAYYAQQQQYYQGDSQHNAHIQNTPYAQQQQPYGGATFN